jgi:triosephosphate isomerase (TIM)
MPKKFIIGNWKMQLTHDESVSLAKELKTLLSSKKLPANTEIAVAPDFLSLAAAAKVLKDTGIVMAAQDGWYEEEGSFTGEVSLRMLKDLGCQYVILGHSERRKFLNETDELINKKITAALKYGLTPIVCIGETFDQRKDGRKDVVIMQQVQAALKGIDIKPEQTLIIAYEPVWVIGSGQAIDPAEAVHTTMIIKQSLTDVLEHQDLPLVKIIYGGSVDAQNINAFVSSDAIEGALVGGASLQAEEFIKLIKQA